MHLPIPTTLLPSGEPIPVLGQGTWFMGEQKSQRAEEAAALRLGIELGMTLIDTAEMYGNGGAEEVVADAAESQRDRLFIVSKVLPSNASRRGTVAACERSLRRLRTDRIDLYLLHWRGSVPLEETLGGFAQLQREGKIRHWGVSNFDTDDMDDLIALQGSNSCAVNQVLYNLTRRGIEFDLLHYCRDRGIPLMAYSPIEQGRMLRHVALKEIALRRNVTPAQVALAWLLRREGVIGIPKASDPQHVRENRAAVNLQLSDEDIATLDKSFPPPRRKRPLEML